MIIIITEAEYNMYQYTVYNFLQMQLSPSLKKYLLHAMYVLYLFLHQSMWVKSARPRP